MLVDTHCHLASPRFDADRAAVIQRALDCGVTRMIAISTSMEDLPQVLELAREHEPVFATAGIHPCEVTVSPPAAEVEQRLRSALARPQVVALGESGLDFFHPPPEGWSEADYRRLQREFFQMHLRLGAESGRPVVVHHRGEGCWEAVAAEVRAVAGVRAVFHCYGGTWEAARPLIEGGHLISFTGTVTYKNARALAETARGAAAGSFMLETDAPYLAPVPHRGSRCEPAHVRDTAAFIAQLRGVPPEEVAEMTTRAAVSFFGLE